GRARARRHWRRLHGGAAGAWPRGGDQGAHPVGGPSRPEALPPGGPGHGADQPPQPRPGPRHRADGRHQLPGPRARPWPLLTRLDEPGADSAASGLPGDARRAPSPQFSPPATLMAKHVQAPPQPPSVFRPGLNPGLEELILKSLSKRPEDRFQTGKEFDEAISRVADQMFPGWQRSLEPGVDLSQMVPRPTPSVLPSTPIGGAIAQPGTAATPRDVVYNPA